MSLMRVTITGADDGVDPAELGKLSLAFPFVEWGILRSYKHERTARYPSRRWISRLGGGVGLPRFAAHLCGQMSREAMSGDEPWIGDLLVYARVQLNGFSNFNLPGLRIAGLRPHTEFILQCSDGMALAQAQTLADGRPNISALWDLSGGRGAFNGHWPAPRPGLRLAYAGGITPDNVVSVVSSIGVVVNAAAPLLDLSFGIDMEAGVRTDDRFDLDKVRAVLERAAPFVRSAT